MILHRADMEEIMYSTTVDNEYTMSAITGKKEILQQCDK